MRKKSDFFLMTHTRQKEGPWSDRKVFVYKHNIPSRSKWKFHHAMAPFWMPALMELQDFNLWSAKKDRRRAALRLSAPFIGTAEAAGLLQRKHPSNKPCSGQYTSASDPRGSCGTSKIFPFDALKTHKSVFATNFPPDPDRPELWRAENANL